MNPDYEQEHVELRRKFRSMKPWLWPVMDLRMVVGGLLLHLGMRLLEPLMTPTTARLFENFAYSLNNDDDVAREGIQEAADLARRSLWHP